MIPCGVSGIRTPVPGQSLKVVCPVETYSYPRCLCIYICALQAGASVLSLRQKLDLNQRYTHRAEACPLCHSGTAVFPAVTGSVISDALSPSSSGAKYEPEAESNRPAPCERRSALSFPAAACSASVVGLRLALFCLAGRPRYGIALCRLRYRTLVQMSTR